MCLFLRVLKHIAVEHPVDLGDKIDGATACHKQAAAEAQCGCGIGHPIHVPQLLGQVLTSPRTKGIQALGCRV